MTKTLSKFDDLSDHSSLNALLTILATGKTLSGEQWTSLNGRVIITQIGNGRISFTAKPAFYEEGILDYARLDAINGNCYRLLHPYLRNMLAVNGEVYTLFTDAGSFFMPRRVFEPTMQLERGIIEAINSRKSWRGRLVPNWKFNLWIKKSSLTLGNLDFLAEKLLRILEKIGDGDDGTKWTIIATGTGYERRFDISWKDVYGIKGSAVLTAKDKVFYLEI